MRIRKPENRTTAGGSTRAGTSKSENKATGILFVSIGARHARREAIELAIIRAESECRSLIVCFLDTPEIVNRTILFSEPASVAEETVRERCNELLQAISNVRTTLTLEFRRFAEYAHETTFSKYESVVRAAYEHDARFRRHVQNQTFRNLQPLLARQGIGSRTDRVTVMLAEYLLLELSLMLYVAQEGIADVYFGYEPEMGIVSALYAYKYDGLREVLSRRLRYESVGQDLVLEDITLKRYEPDFSFDHLALRVPAGTRFGILGPNGSGKTTLLKIIGGHLHHDEGRILWGDADLSELPPGQRPTATVFQDLALFPHLKAIQNVSFGVRCKRGYSKSKAEEVAREWLDRLELRDYEEARPATLSVGQQQRTAIARALAIRPAILLLDEPTSALDSVQRDELATILRDASQKGWANTIILVSHDFDFALAVCDYAAILDKGKVLAAGRMRELYLAPPTGKIAKLLGLFNVVAGHITDQLLFESSAVQVRVPAKFQRLKGTSACLLLRPDHLSLRAPSELDAAIDGMVEDVIQVGANNFMSVRTVTGLIKVDAGQFAVPVRSGDSVRVSFSVDNALFVPCESAIDTGGMNPRLGESVAVGVSQSKE